MTMRAKHSALILTAGFLLIPTMSWSQFPGFGGGGAPGGGRMGMQMDPDQLFNFASKGQDVIRVDELDPFSKSMFDRFASRLGLTGNEITREQFKGAMVKAQEMAASGQFGNGGMTFRMGMPGGGDSPAGGFPGGGGFADRDRVVEEYFKRLDANQDGMLEFSELGIDRTTEALADEREKYDTNHDGAIDLPEFKAFMAARSNPQDGGRGPDGAKEDERKRPTLIRAGNLPRDFPYAELDADADGQIGLYEWKAGGKRVAEFLPMDLNNDGFLTYDEYSRYRTQSSGSMGGGGQFGRGAAGGGMMAMGGNRGGAFPGMGGGGNFPGMGGDRGSFNMGGGSFPGMGGNRGGNFPGMGGGSFPGMGGGSFPGIGGGSFPGMGGDRGGSFPGMGGDRGGNFPGMGGDRGRSGNFPGMGGDRGGSFPGMGGDRGGSFPGIGGDRGGNFPGMGGDRGRGGNFPGMGGPTAGGAPGVTPQGAGLTQPGMGNRSQGGPGGENGGGRRGNNGGGAPGGPKGKR